MEVHTHSHTARKKWTHYLWEFLMLFLAVFCGFLAEYQLEHKIEKERGLQYIRSFYNDLKSDTAEFRRIIATYENKVDAFSKRTECYDSLTSRIKNFTPCIAKLIKNCTSFPDIVNADQTLLQLKNAGGLRLLKQADADSILDYDKKVRVLIKAQTTGFQETQYRIRELLNSIRNYKSLMPEKPDPTIPVLITNEPEKINQFFLTLDEYALDCDYQLRLLKKLNLKATGLIFYFKNKYHFD